MDAPLVELLWPVKMTQKTIDVTHYGKVKEGYKVDGKIIDVKAVNGKFKFDFHPLCDAGVLLANDWQFVRRPRGGSYVYLGCRNGRAARRRQSPNQWLTLSA